MLSEDTVHVLFKVFLYKVSTKLQHFGRSPFCRVSFCSLKQRTLLKTCDSSSWLVSRGKQDFNTHMGEVLYLQEKDSCR